MKITTLGLIFGGISFFSYPTDLSPNINTTVLAISEASKINPVFIAAVINTANPTGEIPDTYDLFGTGESYTSCASSICHFVRFIQKQDLHPGILQNDPELTIRILARKGIIRDSCNVLEKLK